MAQCSSLRGIRQGTRQASTQGPQSCKLLSPANAWCVGSPAAHDAPNLTSSRLSAATSLGRKKPLQGCHSHR